MRLLKSNCFINSTVHVISVDRIINIKFALPGIKTVQEFLEIGHKIYTLAPPNSSLFAFWCICTQKQDH